MPLSDFTYQVNHPAYGTRMVNPLLDDLVFVDQEDKQEVFTIRELDTTFDFRDGDYDYFKQILDNNDCERITIEISVSGFKVWEGELKINSGQWRFSDCRWLVTPKVISDYFCINNLMEKELNIIDLATVVPPTSQILGEIEIAKCEGDFVLPSAVQPPCGDMNNDLGWTLIREGFRYVDFSGGVDPDVYHTDKTFARETLTVNCTGGLGGTPAPPPGAGWLLSQDDCATLGHATWVRPVNVEFNEVDSTVPENDVNPNDPRQTYILIWNISGANDLDAEYGANTYDNGRYLQNVIEFLIFDCRLDLVSAFFGWGANDGPNNAPYNIAAQELQTLVVFQRSDVNRPNDAENATVGVLTLETVLNWLRVMFNCRWIVTNDTLRIEHISYFSDVFGFDTTLDAENELRQRGLDNITFIEDEIPRYERWNWADTTQDVDFDGLEIEYPEPCSVNEAAEYTLNDMITDVTEIEGSEDDEGFVMVALAQYGANVAMISSIGAISGEPKINGALSWANLLQNYHTWERLYPIGNLNGIDTTFDTYKRIKQQDEIEIPVSYFNYFLGFNATDLVKTSIGWGKVEVARYSAKSCILSLVIRHP